MKSSKSKTTHTEGALPPRISKEKDAELTTSFSIIDILSGEPIPTHIQTFGKSAATAPQGQSSESLEKTDSTMEQLPHPRHEFHKTIRWAQ